VIGDPAYAEATADRSVNAESVKPRRFVLRGHAPFTELRA
jgi:hypothetical protein